MTTVYVLLLVLYVLGAIGSYRMTIRSKEFLEAYASIPETVALPILILCSALWLAVDVINAVSASFRKLD